VKRSAKVLLLHFSLLAAGTAGVMAADVQDRTIRFSIGLAEEHPQGQGVKKFAEIVDQKSGGKLKVKGYFSGSLGDDTRATQALQGGIQEMTSPSTSPLVGMIKEFGVFDFPFLFNSEKEADAVLDGPFGQKMLDKLPEKGLIGLCYWENGFRQATNSRRAVAKADDFRGIKIRTMQNSVYLDTFRTLGANAVPMAFTELYTALETKTVDGQENPIPTIDASKFNEVQKYLSLTRHSYTPFVVLVSKRFWDKLNPEEKTILQEACVEARDFQRTANREANARILEQLKSKGMQVNDVTPDELAKMREAVKPVVEKYTKEFGEDMVKVLNAEIAKVRNQ
jgi:TRAP-type transport system periplasmic protein